MAQTEVARPRVLDTGVPNLDQVLGGGLQQHNAYIIAGASGTGKSVLSLQIAFHRAKQGDRVLLVTGLTEPHRNLLEHLATFRFVDLKLIGPQIETVSMVPFLERPVADQIEVLRKTVLNSRPQLVIVDGLRSFDAFVGGARGIYQFVYGLTSWLAVEGITLLLTRDTGPTAMPQDPEFSLVDGVVFLRHDLIDGSDYRRLWIWKMRGQRPLGGLHAYSLDDSGMTVWPRPAATFRPEDRPVSTGKAASGVPALDRMLGGGLPEATSTLLLGGPGTGKTELALAYLRAGAEHNQPGLWLGFRESRSRLLAIGQASGVDLGQAESRGAIRFDVRMPMELDAGHLAADLGAALAGLKARRLVIDGIEALESALPDPRCTADFLTWLVQYLGQSGITSLITRQVPRIVGQEFNVPEMPLASLAHGIIVVRHVEEQAQLHRALAILRMPGIDYDPTIRRMTIDEHGISLGDPLPTEIGQLALRSSMEPASRPV